MGRVVIFGASRGLGLEFTRQYLEAGDQVFALARDPESSVGLQELVSKSGTKLRLLPCDVTDRRAVAAAAGRIGGEVAGVDLVLHNAGIAGQTGQGIENIEDDDLRRVFEVNTIAPLHVAAEFLPLLRRGEDAKIVFLTSRMGSIADNSGGGWWAYRMSKAALNMACKNLSIELDGSGIATMVVHPGWVQTDMGGAAAPLSPTDSVAGMRTVIDGLRVEDSGVFRDYSGEALPW